MNSLLRSPWAPRVAALLAGIAAGLAHPPFGFLAGVLGFGALMRLGDTEGARPLRSAALRGWLAGLGYFAVSVWWVTEAFMVDAATYGWMAPFALVLLAGGLALFWAAALTAYRAVGVRGLPGVAVFAGAVAGMEWLRGHVLTGFPWNLPGELWPAGSPPSQAAAVIGVYGLSWITLVIGGCLGLLWSPGSWRYRGVGALIGLAALGGLFAYGSDRLGPSVPAAGGPVVRIVQANVDQKEKWRPENLDSLVEAYASLTRRPAARTPDVVVWPEGALPAVIDDLVAPGSPYLWRLTAMLKPGQTLMMGANRAGLSRSGAAGEFDYFNSLVAFRREEDGLRVSGVYDKHKLVPFGEFVPLGDLAGRIGLRSLVHMPEDFTAGPEPAPIQADGLPRVQPLICYEALFPELTRGAMRARNGPAQWLLNVSNDAWFGVTSGPHQHLNIARYRAIESGLPMVRSTPTGISAIIDPYGRIVAGASLRQGAFGVIDAPLPAALATPPYVSLGDMPFALMVAASALAGLAGRGANRGRLQDIKKSL